MLEDRLKGTESEVLGLRARLSQAWLAPGLLCAIIYIVKLQLLQQFVKTTFRVMENIIATECDSVARMAEQAVKAPQEAVDVANQLIAASVNSGVRGLLEPLQILAKAIEGLILFALDLTIGSYACLTVSAVDIAANEALNATESVVGIANSTAESIGKDLNMGLNKLSTFINSAVGLIDTVEDFITGGKADLKSINFTVSRLNHLNISSSINTRLESLRKDIPTYDGTKAAVEQVISEPFKLLQSQINSTNITFRPNLFPTQSQISIQGCDIANVKADIARLEAYVVRVVNVLCMVCALCALGAIILNFWRATRRYRRLETIAAARPPLRKNLTSDEAVAENMQLITSSENSFLERLLANRASQRSVWLARYVTHLPLLTLVSLGMAGIIISMIELIVLALLKSGARDLEQLTSSGVKDLTGQVRRALVTWRNETNTNIAHTESQINSEVLGWVYQGSQSVNKSLSVFMTSINDDITKYFNGTMFVAPLQAVVQCFIGSKVAAVEEGLTWIHEHSQISLPRIPLQLLASNATQGLAPKIKSESTQVYQSALSGIHRQIVVQSVVSGALIGVWCIFAIAAYIYAFHLKESSRRGPSKEGSELSLSSSREKSIQPALRRINGPPPPIIVVPRGVQSNIKSPAEQIIESVSNLFSGPGRKARVSGLPHQASVHFEHSPRTPLIGRKF